MNNSPSEGEEEQSSNSTDSGKQGFERLQAGLSLIGEIEEQIDDESADPQLERARSHIATASRKVGAGGLGRHFAKAMGTAASVAISYGYDDLADEAMALGGGADD